MKANVSGIWRNTLPHVKAAGSWRAVKTGYVNVAGVWKPFYQQSTGIITPGSKLSGVMTVGVSSGSGITTYGQGFGSGNLVPNTLNTGGTWTYFACSSDGTDFSIIEGNTTATNMSLRLDDKAAISFTNGLYDSKYNWTTYTVTFPPSFTRAQCYAYMAGKYNVATIKFNVD